MKKKFDIAETICFFCKLYKPTLRKREIKILLETSPFYPSLLSVYRTLLACGIDCRVVKTNIQGLLSLHKTALLHIKEKGEEKLILVKILNKEQLAYYDPIKRKYRKFSVLELSSLWDGVTVYANNPEQEKVFNYWVMILPVLFIVLLVNGISGILYALNILGMMVSILLMMREKNFADNLSTPYCMIGKYFDCDKVINSRFSQIYKLSLSEIGVFYFSSHLLWITIAISIAIPERQIWEHLMMINLLCIPFLFFFISYQAFYLKKWCLLCLSICFIICCEILVSLYLKINPTLPLLTIELHSIACLICGIGVFSLSKYLTLLREKDKREKELLKMKRNPMLFSFLKTKQMQLKEYNDDYLSLGNNSSSLIITTWISPFCTYCREVVEDMISLYDKSNGNIQWRIYFSGEYHKDINHNQIQYYLITSYRKDKMEFMNIIKEWYKYHDIKLFNKKGILPTNDDISILDRQVMYSKKAQIRSYPTIFLNGFLLPTNYSLKDLYFILHDKELWES